MLKIHDLGRAFRGQTLSIAMILGFLAVGTTSHAGWTPKVGGVLGKAGKNVSEGWKSGPGEAWNRGVRDPWQEHVTRPFFVENPWVRGGQRAMSEEQEAARKLEEQKRRAAEEARRAWNQAFSNFEFQLRQFAESHKGQFVSRQELERFIVQQRQRWIQANPFPGE